ncbi:MAG: 4-alpha-glucanotransferase, partial [Thermodesulfobacteriota bacterium]
MLKFIFCIHNHQPVGNFDFVLEDAFVKAYMPFLELLEKHPALKVSYHTTGFLLDWLAENHPEYIELLKRLVARGQVEIMGGGYYEPILSVIPEADRV